jgi:hypothetical protein
MTPKEKAQELFNRFNQPDRTNYPYVHNAQQCALIAVNELIKENLRYDYIPFEGSRTEFYLQVEKELNKL